jgi:DNA-binding transcriptional LysR family regulator
MELIYRRAMQIQSLKMFCDLAETESFTRTAQINQVTQAAVSQQTSALEHQFKSLLIERSRKKFRLTREGQVFYDYSKQILETFDSLSCKLQEIRHVLSGTIRVATIYSLGLYDLPRRLKGYLQSCPEVNVHVEYRREDEIYEDVLTNVVDLGLVAYPRHDRHFEILPLGHDQLVLICHPLHLLASSHGIKLSALANEKFVAFDKDLPTGQAIDHILKQRRIQVQKVMEFDNIETIKQAVEINMGIAIVPQDTLTRETAQKTLAQVELLEGDFQRPLAAVMKKGRAISPAMKQLLAALKRD